MQTINQERKINMAKRYTFITRKSGKKANIRGVATRQEAREIKAANGFRHAIFDNLNQRVIR